MRLGRLLGKPAATSGQTDRAEASKGDLDPLLMFASEGKCAEGATRTVPPEARQTLNPAPVSRPVVLALVIVVAVAIAGAWAIGRVRFFAPVQAAKPHNGHLTIETEPIAAEVLVDGERRGVTPMTMTISPGAHSIVLRQGGEERTIPLRVAPGAELSQYVELKATEPAPARVGKISVVTEPPGARVRIDGQLRGRSPITVDELMASEHKVAVGNETSETERTVTVEAGATTSVVFSMAKPAAPIAGWMTMSTPFDVQIAERDTTLGFGKTFRIMMPVGRHDVTLVNESLGYREDRTVDIGGGSTTTVRIDPLRRPVNINARPWADVFVDGASVGQTPIANLTLTVGAHDVVFRHPQFGERSQNVIVTARGTNRIAVDLTK